MIDLTYYRRETRTMTIPWQECDEPPVPIVGIAPDTGCKYAASKVGHPTHCQECPFPECIDGDIVRYRREVNKPEAIKLCLQGLTTAQIAARLKLSLTIIKQYTFETRRHKRLEAVSIR